MDKAILTALTTGTPVRLHAMSMIKFIELLNQLQEMRAKS